MPDYSMERVRALAVEPVNVSSKVLGREGLKLPADFVKAVTDGDLDTALNIAGTYVKAHDDLVADHLKLLIEYLEGNLTHVHFLTLSLERACLV